MKYKVMYRLQGKSVWNTEGFDDEKQALSFAESQKSDGAKDVEVYQKARIGYRRIR